MFSSALRMRWACSRIEEVALLERPLKRVLQILQRILVKLAEAVVLVLEPAFQKKIGKSFKQIFRAQAEIVAAVFRIANGSAWQCLIELPPLPRSSPAFFLLRCFPLALAGCEVRSLHCG